MAFVAHEDDDAANPQEGGSGYNSGFQQYEDKRHPDRVSYIDSMIAGTANTVDSSPTSVPLS